MQYFIDFVSQGSAEAMGAVENWPVT